MACTVRNQVSTKVCLPNAATAIYFAANDGVTVGYFFATFTFLTNVLTH